MTFTLPILYDFENDVYYLQLSQEIMDASNFQINSTIRWTVNDNSITLTQVSTIENQSQIDLSYYGC